MFIDANQLLKLKDLKKVHAISFEWFGFKPEFLFYSGQGNPEKLSLQDIFMMVGGTKTCVGRFSKEEYIPCPARLPVTNFIQCSACAKSFIPQLRCVFEPRCNGELCPEALFCKKEHKVYLAFFGNLVKIGMTSTQRLMRRMIEQGSDAYAIIDTVDNRKEARDLEKKIGSDLKIRQSHLSKEILGELPEPTNSKILPKFNELKHEISDKYKLNLSELSFIRGYPLKDEISSVPGYVDSQGLHVGKVIGIKGRYLLYRNQSGIRALDLCDIVARDINVEIDSG